jgi:hypothetical protein
MMRSGNISIHKPINWLLTLGIVLLTMSFACNTSGKEETTPEGPQPWTLTVKGRVGFPQQGGQITITEIKENGQPGGYQDTITLKSNYTYAKKVKLTQPGYYKINFYNKQVVSLILDKADVEVNVDGNNPQGFFEVKGSPDLDLIKKIQALQAASQNAPELEKINQEYQVAAQSKNEQRMGELYDQYMAIVKGYTDQIADLMVKESPSLAVINLMTNGTPDKDQYHSAYVAVAEKLKKEWPNYEYSKNFITLVSKLKLTAIGQPVKLPCRIQVERLLPFHPCEANTCWLISGQSGADHAARRIRTLYGLTISLKTKDLQYTASHLIARKKIG